MKCQNCRKRNNPKAKYCEQCGKKLEYPVLAGSREKKSSVPVSARPKMPSWAWVLIGLGGVGLVIGGLYLGGVFQPKASTHALAQSSQSTASTPTSQSATSTATSQSATKTPSPYLLFDEFFNPGSGWPTLGDQSQGEAGYGEHAYRIAFYQPTGYQSAWSPEGYGEFSNFIAETSICTTRSIPSIGAGLTLRASQDGEYVFWVFPASGDYFFMKTVDGQVFFLIPYTHIDGIQPAEENGKLCLTLKAAAHGDIFDFWVSGNSGEYQYLESVRDDELLSGRIGLSADSPKTDFSPSPVEALFDWIKVSPYSAQSLPALSGNVPLVRVAQNTNCRSGPGDPYAIVRAFIIGETAEVVGRGSDDQWWIIQIPGMPQTCWLWNEYAMVTSDTSGLPVVQAPTLTPTPDSSSNLVQVAQTAYPQVIFTWENQAGELRVCWALDPLVHIYYYVRFTRWDSDSHSWEPIIWAYDGNLASGPDFPRHCTSEVNMWNGYQLRVEGYLDPIFNHYINQYPDQPQVTTRILIGSSFHAP